MPEIDIFGKKLEEIQKCQEKTKQNLDIFRTPQKLDIFRTKLDNFRTPRFTDDWAGTLDRSDWTLADEYDR